MKRQLAVILMIVLVISLLAACGAENPDDSTETPTAQSTEPATEPEKAFGMHTLYFRDSNKSDKAVAHFFNSDSDAGVDIVMEKIEEDGDSCTFSCEGDCSLENMVIVTDGEKKTERFAFNPCTSGWYKTEDDLLPYTYGKEIDYLVPYEEVVLEGCGHKKPVYIWTPEGYDPDSAEKYATIYMLDGQGMAYFGRDNQPLKGCPVVTEQVEAMMAVTDNRAIVVCIQSDVARSSELIPKLGLTVIEKDHGEMEYDCMNGTQFADFAAHTLVPYIRRTYNVYTDALHTAVVGCSFGGVEATYIPLEYPGVFGAGGELSPSYWIYDSETWDNYIGKKSFGDDSPFLYIYSGGAHDTEVEGEVTGMIKRLKDNGYPADKIAFNYYDEGTHSSLLWRNVFSEFLTAMFYRTVEPLQK